MDTSGRELLLYAARDGDHQLVVRLLNEGVNPDVTDIQGFTPLHLAAQQSHLAVVLALLRAGARVDAVNCFGNTPLWTATYNANGQGEIIASLLAAGANPRHQNNAGRTPIDLAHLIGSADVARFFGDS